MHFFALDYETANADQSSICQIGLVEVRDGSICDQNTWLVDPEAAFDFINTSIHGIDQGAVQGAPKLKEKLPELLNTLDGHTVISHSAFDRVATFRACEKLGFEVPRATWLDSARMVRRAWPEDFAKTGYGLKNVASKLGIDFEHHDAGEDAKACAQIVIRAIAHTGLSLDDWQKRITQPIQPAAEDSSDPDPDGPFFGATMVFTGALTMPRREAVAYAAAAGFTVGKSVGKKTNVLIVGDQDATKLAGKDKSSKHIKAEQLILAGQEIDILSESDFRALIEGAQT